MVRFLSNPRFLAAYSGVLTVAFILTVVFGVSRGAPRFSAAGPRDWRHADFDQLTIHRINIVEPDGTPRLILSDKAEYPGSFYHGKEIARTDRTDSAGMLFINDEGTENGGMLFGGYKDKDGAPHSWGHLSFDEYEQDQTLSMDSYQEGPARSSHIKFSDNPAYPLTPQVMAEFQRVKSMPHGPDRQKAWADLQARYPPGSSRAFLGRTFDNKSALELDDPQGHARIKLEVSADGAPAMQFLDAAGNVTHTWPETSR